MKYRQVSQSGKPVFVGSVFSKVGGHQPKLFELQLGYLRATTPHFHYFVTVSNNVVGGFDKLATVLPPESDTVGLIGTKQHIAGLNRLLDYAKEHADEYDSFMFLDSDAFPIRPWQEVLGRLMADWQLLAAPLRTEHLESMVHVCAMVVKKEAIRDLRFSLGPRSIYKANLWPNSHCGRRLYGIVIEPFAPNAVLPLVKSNRHDMYPHMCTVYGNLFYHHTFGSHKYRRTKHRDQVRPRQKGAHKYWCDVIDDPPPDPAELLKELLDDPHKFISNLAGWGPYPKPLV